ncbi:uncharacterized protein LOC112591641 [Melanaphis sacchari]|uniref:uncharacterized protein LOC112591641 n=1 Tax=Melanaphis sacchari TaxID=742174 RepID=UPI000DC13F54|nr:uncharacterized protein LOC112591641 [Melanaphis sacchari]
MGKFKVYLLVFLLITGSRLNTSARAALCDPMIKPCLTGSCMPCDFKKEQSIDEDDCMNPNGCPEVTKIKLEPPSSDLLMRQPLLFSNQMTTCLFYFWNMCPFYWNTLMNTAYPQEE